MKGIQIFVFIFIMWLMIIGGGGLVVSIIAPISFSSSDKNYDNLLDSGIKAAIAILLVVAWIYIMSKIKNWIFQKQIKN